MGLPEKSQHPHLANLAPKEIEIGKLIYKINYLISFPMDDILLTEWSKNLNRIMPDLDIHALSEIIDKMLTGEIEYDTRKGIQNIFLALKPKTIKATGNFAP